MPFVGNDETSVLDYKHTSGILFTTNMSSETSRPSLTCMEIRKLGTRNQFMMLSKERLH